MLNAATAAQLNLSMTSVSTAGTGSTHTVGSLQNLHRTQFGISDLLGLDSQNLLAQQQRVVQQLSAANAAYSNQQCQPLAACTQMFDPLIYPSANGPGGGGNGGTHNGSSYFQHQQSIPPYLSQAQAQAAAAAACMYSNKQQNFPNMFHSPINTPSHNFSNNLSHALSQSAAAAAVAANQSQMSTSDLVTSSASSNPQTPCSFPYPLSHNMVTGIMSNTMQSSVASSCGSVHRFDNL